MRGSCVTRNDELPQPLAPASSSMRHLLSRRSDRDQRLILRSPHCVCPYCCSSIGLVLLPSFHPVYMGLNVSSGCCVILRSCFPSDMSDLFPRVSFHVCVFPLSSPCHRVSSFVLSSSRSYRMCTLLSPALDPLPLCISSIQPFFPFLCLYSLLDPVPVALCYLTCIPLMESLTRRTFSPFSTSLSLCIHLDVPLEKK